MSSAGTASIKAQIADSLFYAAEKCQLPSGAWLLFRDTATGYLYAGHARMSPDNKVAGGRLLCLGAEDAAAAFRLFRSCKRKPLICDEGTALSLALTYPSIEISEGHSLLCTGDGIEVYVANHDCP